jgi:hypothetical protein
MKVRILAAAASLALLTSGASAFVAPGVPSGSSATNIIHVANGCGPNRYRGPGGACHRWGYGPGPGWWGPGWRYGPGPGWRWNGGCGPGRHRGPWGHCRHN